MNMWRTCGKFSQKDPEQGDPMQPNVCGVSAKDGLAFVMLTLAPPHLLRSWV